MMKIIIVLISILLLNGCTGKPIEPESPDISIKTESESSIPESEITNSDNSETEVSIPESGLIFSLVPDSCPFDDVKETYFELFIINPTDEEIECPWLYPFEFDFYDNGEWIPLPIIGYSIEQGWPPPPMMMPQETRFLTKGTFYNLLVPHWKNDLIVPGKYRLKMCNWPTEDENVVTWYAEFTLT